MQENENLSKTINLGAPISNNVKSHHKRAASSDESSIDGDNDSNGSRSLQLNETIVTKNKRHDSTPTPKSVG